MMVIVKSGLPAAIDVGEVDEMTIDEFPPAGDSKKIHGASVSMRN